MGADTVLATARAKDTFMALSGRVGHEYQHVLHWQDGHRHQHGPWWQHGSWTATWFQTAAHATDIHVAFSVNMNHKHQCGFRQQYRPQTSTQSLATAGTTDTIVVFGGGTDHRHRHGLQWLRGPWILTWFQVAACSAIFYRYVYVARQHT